MHIQRIPGDFILRLAARFGDVFDQNVAVIRFAVVIQRRVPALCDISVAEGDNPAVGNGAQHLGPAARIGVTDMNTTMPGSMRVQRITTQGIDRHHALDPLFIRFCFTFCP
ncbi:hypothetical protein ACFL9S_22900 [Erwinia sp. AnSW2-5]|uniref:hypothetical protein n=1 Tax=Erwinia sp. AnSW2-5 TaxID=3367692 RepID=UPI00385EB0E3